MRIDGDPCCNWWIESHAWVLNDAGKQDSLTIMFLNKDFLDAGQTERKIASYVKFYQPFVVAMVDSRTEDHIYKKLFWEFTGK
jgi:hypothetical protein